MGSPATIRNFYCFSHAQHALTQNFRGKNFKIRTKTKQFWIFYYSPKVAYPWRPYDIKKSRESMRSKTHTWAPLNDMEGLWYIYSYCMSILFFVTPDPNHTLLTIGHKKCVFFSLYFLATFPYSFLRPFHIVFCRYCILLSLLSEYLLL
jgi:hypothetical protein